MNTLTQNRNDKQHLQQSLSAACYFALKQIIIYNDLEHFWDASSCTFSMILL